MDDSSDHPAVPTTGVVATGVLLTVAFAGAVAAGVLGSVGPYLLGVSVLVVSLFVAASSSVPGRR